MNKLSKIINHIISPITSKIIIKIKEEILKQNEEIQELKRLNIIIIQELQELNKINRNTIKSLEYQDSLVKWVQEMRQINIDLWNKLELCNKK